MNHKFLVIGMVGDNSRHKEWIAGHRNFDFYLSYYGDNPDNINDYQMDCDRFFMLKGQKYPTLKYFIQTYYDEISSYEYVWLPDDDVSISTEGINRMFELSEYYDLYISQPAVTAPNNIVSHWITRPVEGSLLRYTNFVEPMAPCFKSDKLLKLYNEFDLAQTGWGLDYLWELRLDHPVDKLAVIDDIIMVHSKPFLIDYNETRFKISGFDELDNILEKYNITPSQVVYSTIYK